jgi:DNA-binding response OmpR family regulator
METLLFIEDDDGIRLALSMALEDEGYDVRQAPNGEQGLAEFRRTPPDLVLLDLRLPDMSGFDVCRALRAESIVPIIMITAQTDTHDMVAGLEAGADDYVTKPVVPKELAARIRALLRRVQLQGKTTAPLATRFGDIEIRREQGIVLKGGDRAQPHQDRVPADVRIRRPCRRRALP